MPLSSQFNKKAKPGPNRPAPFSIRLTDAERDRLTEAAAGAPLGSFIKSRALDEPLPARFRRRGIVVEDRQALAKALALLGRSRLSDNLNQIAHAVNIGVLPVTPETEAELFAAVREVRQIRNLLIAALGMKVDQSP